jgi:hypothetical protein
MNERCALKLTMEANMANAYIVMFGHKEVNHVWR